MTHTEPHLTEPITIRTPLAPQATPLVMALLGDALTKRTMFKLEARFHPAGDDRTTFEVEGYALLLELRLTLEERPTDLIVVAALTLDVDDPTLSDALEGWLLDRPMSARTDPRTGALRALMLDLERPPEATTTEPLAADI